MVKRCVHGICKSDSRYPDKLHGAKFIPFIKPRQNYKKCLRWIMLCRRPTLSYRLNDMTTETISRNTYVCSKHFHNGIGPSDDYPDPCDAINGEFMNSETTSSNWYARNTSEDGESIGCATSVEMLKCDNKETVGVSIQTEETLFSSMDMLSCVSQIHELELENKKLKEKINVEKTSQSTQTDFLNFSPESVNNSSISGLFKFYSGLEYCRFLLLLNFLFPGSKNDVTYSKSRKEVRNMPVSHQLFLVLCRLRNGLNVKDLAFRFSVKCQTVSSVFTSVIKFMYLRLGSLSYWPHRNIIMANMPEEYKNNFPFSMALIDCTEIKTERPSSLLCQSQCFSDYKSSTTMKSLVVCDPRGSIIFLSDLFSGCISDSDICKKSGFFEYLGNLLARGFLLEGDAIMADKGFHIEKELRELGLQINIPPLNSKSYQMTSSDVSKTRKIATHRIHVERAINQIKCFKILKKKLPVSLFHVANDIWFVCSMLTNFQDTLLSI